jgi:hypothetical protein
MNLIKCLKIKDFKKMKLKQRNINSWNEYEYECFNSYEIYPRNNKNSLYK